MDEAYLRVMYQSLRSARSVAEAISVDNRTSPEGLMVETSLVGRAVVTKVYSKLSLGTMVSTLDDILQSMQTAEDSVGALLDAQGRPLKDWER